MTNTIVETPRVSTPTLHDYRRTNLRKLVKDLGGPTSFCKLIKMPNASTIVQMTGANPIREVSEKTVRDVEAKLDLVPGCLDAPVDVPESELGTSELITKRQRMRRIKQQANIMGVEPVYADDARAPYKVRPPQYSSRPQVFGLEADPEHQSGMVSIDALSNMLLLIGRVTASEKIELPPQKMSDIIALTLLNGGDSPESQAAFLKKLVSLAK